MRTEFRVAGDHVEIKHCKLCSKGNRDKSDNLWKLYVNSNGSFCCFRCNERGSWFELKRRAAGGSGGSNSDGGSDPLYLDSILTPAPAAGLRRQQQGVPTGGDRSESTVLPDQLAAFQFTKVKYSYHLLNTFSSSICFLIDCFRVYSRSIEVRLPILC
jgi:hypothetical protein